MGRILVSSYEAIRVRMNTGDNVDKGLEADKTIMGMITGIDKTKLDQIMKIREIFK